MPTTNWVDGTFGLREIPNRTDNTGTELTEGDLPLREDQLINLLLTAGVVEPQAAFAPAVGTGDFDVDVGSGTADVDVFVVASTVDGQAPWLVQLKQTVLTVTLDAADADPRLDEIYVVVRDDATDSNADGHRLARVSYRKGDSASSDPPAPGPDPEWTNYALIATISVAAGATEIIGNDITDERARSRLAQLVFDEAVRNTSASVFGEALDGRYVQTTGGTVTGAVTWTSGQPQIERTDADGNTWLVRMDFPSPDQPRLNVRKNGNLHARFQWDETNTRWVLTQGLIIQNGQLTMNDIINMGDQQIKNMLNPSVNQDAATKGYVDEHNLLPGDGHYYNAGVEFVPIIAVEGGGFIKFNSDTLVVGVQGGNNPNPRAVIAPIDFDLVDTLEIRWESAVTDSDTVRFGAYQGEMRGAGDESNARTPDVDTTRSGIFGPVNDTLDVSGLSGRGCVFVEADPAFDDTQTTVYRITKTA